MKQDRFEASIAELRRSEPPACPLELEANVLRRIRLGRAEEADWFAWIDRRISRPGLAFAALALAIATTVATVALSHPEPAPDRLAVARLALGFETFALSGEDPLARD